MTTVTRATHRSGEHRSQYVRVSNLHSGLLHGADSARTISGECSDPDDSRQSRRRSVPKRLERIRRVVYEDKLVAALHEMRIQLPRLALRADREICESALARRTGPDRVE